MCWYILRIALCNHHPPELLSGPSCMAFLSQLHRIHDPSAWNSLDNPNAESSLPFDFPDTCEPNERNTHVVNWWCGRECRNNYDPMGFIEGGDGHHHMGPAPYYRDEWRLWGGEDPGATLGMVHTQYNTGGLGIGWRE